MEPERLTIDLVHPSGNQFVRHLLVALEAAQMLGTYHTGLGFPASTWTRFLPNSLRTECVRRTYPLTSNKLRTRPAREFMRLVSQKLGWSSLIRHEVGWACIDQVFQDLDRAVARDIDGGGTSTRCAAFTATRTGAWRLFARRAERASNAFTTCRSPIGRPCAGCWRRNASGCRNGSRRSWARAIRARSTCARRRSSTWPTW